MKMDIAKLKSPFEGFSDQFILQTYKSNEYDFFKTLRQLFKINDTLKEIKKEAEIQAENEKYDIDAEVLKILVSCNSGILEKIHN